MNINQNIITTIFQKGSGFSFYITNVDSELGVRKKGNQQTLFMVNVEKKEILFSEDCDADIKESVINHKDEMILATEIYLAGFDYGAAIHC